MRRLALLLAALALPSLALAPFAAPAETATPHPVVSEIVTGEAQRLRAFPGVIAAEVETTLGFQTSGRIETRPANLGDAVAAGAVLATLDQITLAQDVATAEAALRAARASADFATQSLARVAELNRRGVAPLASLEAATAKSSAAVAAVHAAEADLARARDAEAFGTLTAPAPGVVTSVLAEPGTTVTPGTPVLKLATEAGREAVIDVPEEVLDLLPPEARFRIEPRGLHGVPVSGRLRLIEPVADASTRARRLRIALGPAGADLRLGTLVSAQLDLPETVLLTLPIAAILTEGTTPQVWRIGAGRRAEAVTVQLGARIGDRVVIQTGLAEGDEVLVRGIHSVTAGETLGPRED